MDNLCPQCVWKNGSDQPQYQPHHVLLDDIGRRRKEMIACAVEVTRQGDEDSASYELVGECFVHGFIWRRNESRDGAVVYADMKMSGQG